MRFLLSILFCICSLFLVPVCACAQNSGNNTHQNVRTVSDNFGGLSLGLKAMMGASPYDDSVKIPKADRTKTWWFLSGSMAAEVCYLFGDTFFIGPHASISIGSPYLIAIDVSAKAAIPFSKQDAFTASIGLGYGIFPGFVLYETRSVIRVNYISPDAAFSDESMPYGLFGLYIPVQFGFETIFDNGLAFGIGAEMKIGFKANRTEYYSITEEDYVRTYEHRGNKDKPGITATFFGLVVYVGYSFRQ